jgi:hypothetical protein
VLVQVHSPSPPLQVRRSAVEYHETEEPAT